MRRAFFHYKNDERRRQQTYKENTLINSLQEMIVTSPVVLPDVQESMANVSLPEHWQEFTGDGVLQWSRMEIDRNGMLQPAASVLLTHDLSWSVHIDRKKVPAICKLLVEFPAMISSPSIVSNLLYCIHNAAVCPGNTDDDLITLCEKRGGTMKKGDTIAYLDNTSLNGQQSVRRVECDVIYEINQLIEIEGIPLHPNDAEDISQIVDDVTPTVTENFPEGSPQRMFWDQQIIYSRLRHKRQMR